MPEALPHSPLGADVSGQERCASRRDQFPAASNSSVQIAGESAQISSSFLRLIIFLAGRLRRPRPSAGIP